MLVSFFHADRLLPLALGISLAVHAVVLAVRLSPPEDIDRLMRDAGLEVILVNTESDEKAPAKPKAPVEPAPKAPAKPRAPKKAAK